MSFEYAYLPIGVPTFQLDAAQAEFEKSAALLKALDSNIKEPDEMLLSIDKLEAFLGSITPDLLVVQNVTFANSAYMSRILHRFSCPVVLWTLREPVIDGGRLRLNSLTGAFSAANALKALGRPFEYIYGAAQEEQVKKSLTAAISAAKLKKAMRDLRVLQVGHTPEGFGFGRALDLDMLNTFGVNLLSIESRELISSAQNCTDEEAEKYLSDAKTRMNGLEKTPEKNRLDFAKLYKAYAEYCEANNIGALASRCWPDFFTAFGTPVCAVLAMLNDKGVSSACEADAYGALSMYAAQYLTGEPAFFGDPVSLDEEENTITFWHCGTAACSLAREDCGACVGVHCNRKIGPTLEFGCKPAPNVTIFRIGRDADGHFRFFICRGEALDRPQQFYGTSLVIKTENDASEIIHSAVKRGWEPHFAVAYGDVAQELTMLADMLGIEAEIY